MLCHYCSTYGLAFYERNVLRLPCLFLLNLKFPQRQKELMDLIPTTETEDFL